MLQCTYTLCTMCWCWCVQASGKRGQSHRRLKHPPSHATLPPHSPPPSTSSSFSVSLPPTPPHSHPNSNPNPLPLTSSVSTLSPQSRETPSASSSPSQGADTQRSASICVVCLEFQATQIVLPCFHLCLCEGCVHQNAFEAGGKCPLCQGDIAKTHRVYSS